MFSCPLTLSVTVRYLADVYGWHDVLTNPHTGNFILPSEILVPYNDSDATTAKVLGYSALLQSTVSNFQNQIAVAKKGKTLEQYQAVVSGNTARIDARVLKESRPTSDDLLLNGSAHLAGTWPASMDRVRWITLRCWYKYLTTNLKYLYPTRQELVDKANDFLNTFDAFLLLYGRDKLYPAVVLPNVSYPEMDSSQFAHPSPDNQHDFSLYPELTTQPKALIRHYCSFVAKLERNDYALAHEWICDRVHCDELVCWSGWAIRPQNFSLEYSTPSALVVNDDVLNPQWWKAIGEDPGVFQVVVADPPFDVLDVKWDKGWTVQTTMQALENVKPLLAESWTLILYTPYKWLQAYLDAFNEAYCTVLYMIADKKGFFNGPRVNPSVQPVIVAFFGPDRTELRYVGFWTLLLTFFRGYTATSRSGRKL